MEQVTELQRSLALYLKSLNLDEAAILFIMLALNSEEAQAAYALFLQDNPQATQEELMEEATQIQKLAEEMKAQGKI